MLNQLKGQFEEKLKEKDAACQAKIEEITANRGQGTYNMSVMRSTVPISFTRGSLIKLNALKDNFL